MQLKNILLFLSLGLLSLFAAANWPAIMQPTELSLIFIKITAPIGLILLMTTALLFVFFLGYLVYWQSSILMAKQKLIKNLETQRQLASKAELSRFTELQNYLQKELTSINGQNIEAYNKINAQLNTMEAAIKNPANKTDTAALSAYK